MSAANILRFELRKPRSPEADNSMRKRVISPTAADAQREQLWLDLSNAASVEVTSEQPGYPIESALLPGHHGGWRAAVAGPQTIRLIFERPCTVRRILLVFEEPDLERTQEFVLRWSPDQGRSFHEIVRQQWNFSPSGSVRETEDYTVSLASVTVIELVIAADIKRGDARASLLSLRLA
jgi:hypothetical protein